MQLELRLASTEDSQTLLEIYRYYIENTVITFETQTPTIDVFAQRIRDISGTYPYLVCLADGKIVGYAYAAKNRERAAYRFNVDTSIYIQEEYHGYGVGSRLYHSLFSILRSLGYVNAYACITLPNPKSQRFHEKHGFSPVGIFRKTGYKMGSWHDVVWFEKQLLPYVNSPAPLRKITEFSHKELQRMLME